ncbi:ATP-binding protein [Actinocrispum wychmicini]|uniref:AAA+ ATPase domain-containing protein n=1 Tax=Actinocrispum wychmicini TaxID=1213861 RepID=A0A4R2JMK5_9PSEU|nr:ATP-binding protein [Actinocrispum wychmicini]TCO59852.1 hypothetical protein EV192_104695 [Actinocrispum wychmicini]
MNESVVRLRPVVSWPRQVTPGQRYLITVDVEQDETADDWPYDQEEYPIGCVLDGRPALDVQSVGDTTIVVHRFGGTYGPAKFVAQAQEELTGQCLLSLTLVTAGGVPFRTLELPVRGTADESETQQDSFVDMAASVAELRLRPVSDRGDRLVGRHAELELMTAFARWPILDAVPPDWTAPVLAFIGAPGSGKTALLTEFARRIGRLKVPYAYFDCAQTTAQTTGEVLSALAYELSRDGGLIFPRLATGLLAISQPPPSDDPARAREQFIELVRVGKRPASPSVLMDVTNPAFRRTYVYVPDLVLRGLSVFPRSRAAVFRRGVQWWGQNQESDSGAVDSLIELCRRAHHSSDHGLVTRPLLAAFLADLRDTFRSGRLAKAGWNCVVMIDNVDTSIGRHVLEELIDARQESVRRSGGPDPLTVLVASSGALEVHKETVVTAKELLRTNTFRQAATRMIPVSLPDLTKKDVAAMEGLPISSILHGFTNGHAASVVTIMRSEVTGLKAPWPLVEEPSIEGKLLHPFIRDLPEPMVNELVTCAAARNRGEVLRFAEHGWGLRETASALPSYLWTPIGWSDSATLHPMLRRLLLRRLAARSPEHPLNWQQVHSWLQEDCARRDDVPGELYHTLALGHMDAVVPRLAELFDEIAHSDWVGILDSVTAAPIQQDQPLLGLDSMAVSREPGVDAAVRQLVWALWQANDRLAARPTYLYDVVDRGFSTLVRCSTKADVEPLIERWRAQRSE